ncbi:MAG: hypothetical protein WCA38_07100, partial [Candidatus Acidiferrales bacterium]
GYGWRGGYGGWGWRGGWGWGGWGWGWGLGWGGWWGPGWGWGWGWPGYVGYYDPFWYNPYWWDDPGYGVSYSDPNYSSSNLSPNGNYGNNNDFGNYNSGNYNSGTYNSSAAPTYNAGADSAGSSVEAIEPGSPDDNPITGNVAASTPTVLIYLKDGTTYAASDYWLADGRLHYVVSYGGESTLDMNDVDLQRTVDENARRGVHFSLKPNPNRVERQPSSNGDKPAPTTDQTSRPNRDHNEAPATAPAPEPMPQTQTTSQTM